MSPSGREPFSALQSLSDNLASAVEQAAASVVAVHARARIASSGIVWRPGVVVTAAHTVRREGEVKVTLGDGHTVSATPAGRDGSTDIAVFRFGGSEASAAEFADPGAPKIGQVVLQVGRTGDAGPSASFGVIGAILKGWRTWRGAEIERLFELDLSIHDGFSGSALVDAGGRVAALNTSGLARGLPLALPTPVVDRIVDALLSKGRVARGYLGVGLQPVELPAQLAGKLSLQQHRGLIVLSVDADGPAATGGLQLGDVMLRVAGVAVTDFRDLFALLSPERVGSTIDVEVLRGGSLQQLRVSIGERPGR